MIILGYRGTCRPSRRHVKPAIDTAVLRIHDHNTLDSLFLTRVKRKMYKKAIDALLLGV